MVMEDSFIDSIAAFGSRVNVVLSVPATIGLIVAILFYILYVHDFPDYQVPRLY